MRLYTLMLYLTLRVICKQPCLNTTITFESLKRQNKFEAYESILVAHAILWELFVTFALRMYVPLGNIHSVRLVRKHRSFPMGLIVFVV